MCQNKAKRKFNNGKYQVYMAKGNIFVVDDEEDILALIRMNLEREGYKVTCIEAGEECVKKAREKLPDLIVLDLMLPGIDGLDVCKLLKNDSKTRHIPIIMLTAKGEESDIVTGLELGADDYMTKPFSPKVLMARVKAVLRKGTVSPESDAGDVIKRKNIVIDPGRREVIVNGKVADLTFTEFEILIFLARRPGWVFTRNQIVNGVKGAGYPVTERAVDVQIVGLRKKLGAVADMIDTIRGVGYRFRD
jgi:two-component system phosphate regulon response regulator PhoB